MSLPADTHFDFGGPLRHLQAGDSWLILGAFFLAAVLAIVLSYRLPGGRVSPGRRAALIGLRLVLVAALLAALADPVRHEVASVIPASTAETNRPRRLAILEDRSESMTTPDNRGETRLDNAERLWERIEPLAQKAFTGIDSYNFAGDLTQPSATDPQPPLPRRPGETRLYQALDSLLSMDGPHRPDAIAVLTDGLDTSGTSSASVISHALARQVPVYVVAGTNRSPPQPYLRIRQWEAPGSVAASTGFTLKAVFEAYSTSERHVEFSLWEGDRKIDGGSLDLGLGQSVIPWTFHVAPSEPKTRTFILRLGPTATSRTGAQSVTIVRKPDRVRTLVVLGALDWGYRTLTDALRSDSHFAASALFFGGETPLFEEGATRSFRFAHLPESPDGYADFDCVILYRTDAGSIPYSEQQALEHYVQGGGNVLFVYPSTERSYDGLPLSYLLPVTLLGADSANSGEAQDSLHPMVLTSDGHASPIFRSLQGADLAPEVSAFTPASEAKPGATVLGLHPEARNAKDGSPMILLATQPYGRGKAAFFAGDGLWRWKLHEDSDSRSVETFWQQLVLAVGQPAVTTPMAFDALSQEIRLGQPVVLTVGGAPEIPEVTVQHGGEPPRRIAVDGSAGAWSLRWTPPSTGDWKVTATPARGLPAYAFVSVNPVLTGENVPAETDVAGLRALASSTGGALLQDSAPPSWRPASEDAQGAVQPLTRESRQLLWNRWSLLAVILGLFSCELILRRRWRLS